MNRLLLASVTTTAIVIEACGSAGPPATDPGAAAASLVRDSTVALQRSVGARTDWDSALGAPFSQSRVYLLELQRSIAKDPRPIVVHSELLNLDSTSVGILATFGPSLASSNVSYILTVPDSLVEVLLRVPREPFAYTLLIALQPTSVSRPLLAVEGLSGSTSEEPPELELSAATHLIIKGHLLGLSLVKEWVP